MPVSVPPPALFFAIFFFIHSGILSAFAGSFQQDSAL
jgi:hypothetical protein